jgi:hypothetical protein
VLIVVFFTIDVFVISGDQEAMLITAAIVISAVLIITVYLLIVCLHLQTFKNLVPG